MQASQLSKIKIPFPLLRIKEQSCSKSMVGEDLKTFFQLGGQIYISKREMLIIPSF